MAKRPFGVIPLDDELPSFPLPKSDLEREGLLKFWTLITEQLRHEDNLFDNRVQGFLISTSFLLAAFSQFREVKFIIVQALICVSGIGLALVVETVLKRTATSIEWFLKTLYRLDVLLFPDNQQPHATRRRLTRPPGKSRLEDKIRPISQIIGVMIPRATALLWFLLLCWAFLELWKGTRATPTVRDYGHFFF